MRKNILFNTTRQWNPGDQIIMLGLLRILRHLDFNIFIYNRHPSVWGKGKDNSFKPGKHTLENIDYYFAAGTPEWADQGLKPLYDEILERKIPHSFVAVGGSATNALKTLGPLQKLLETSDVLTARDQSAYETLKPFGGVLLPCTGFLCGDLPTKIRTKPETIGLIFMSDKTSPNAISPELKKDLISSYQLVIEKHNAVIICHYIDEATEARTYFPHTSIYYSPDAKDFTPFYALCDLVIGPRLHGVLLAAGMGIPSHIIGGYREQDKERRLGGVEPLGLPFLDTKSILPIEYAIPGTFLLKESKRLIDLRYSTEAVYLNLLATKIPFLFTPPTPKDLALNTVRDLIKSRRL